MKIKPFTKKENIEINKVILQLRNYLNMEAQLNDNNLSSESLKLMFQTFEDLANKIPSFRKMVTMTYTLAAQEAKKNNAENLDKAAFELYMFGLFDLTQTWDEVSA